MIGGMLIAALSIFLLVTSATVTLAQSSAVGGSRPAAKAEVANGIPLPPSPPGLREVSVTIPLPSPELLERQSEPDCEIPPSDRLLGAIPETTRLIYERQCYKHAETVVRSKLQLLQDRIAGTVKAFNDAGASRTLQPADGEDQDAKAPAHDVTVAPKTGTSAESSEASGDGARPSVNLSSSEGDLPKSSSPAPTVSERPHLISSSRGPRPQKPLKGLTDFGQLLESIIPGASHRRRQNTK